MKYKCEGYYKDKYSSEIVPCIGCTINFPAGKKYLYPDGYELITDCFGRNVIQPANSAHWVRCKR